MSLAKTFECTCGKEYVHKTALDKHIRTKIKTEPDEHANANPTSRSRSTKPKNTPIQNSKVEDKPKELTAEEILSNKIEAFNIKPFSDKYNYLGKIRPDNSGLFRYGSTGIILGIDTTLNDLVAVADKFHSGELCPLTKEQLEICKARNIKVADQTRRDNIIKTINSGKFLKEEIDKNVDPTDWMGRTYREVRLSKPLGGQFLSCWDQGCTIDLSRLTYPEYALHNHGLSYTVYEGNNEDGDGFGGRKDKDVVLLEDKCPSKISEEQWYKRAAFNDTHFQGYVPKREDNPRLHLIVRREQDEKRRRDEEHQCFLREQQRQKELEEYDPISAEIEANRRLKELMILKRQRDKIKSQRDKLEGEMVALSAKARLIFDE